ncbi:hypothetical protein QFC22_006115 [Naganishia vaughanmartiniae]|uniref:Uncharacterized protein n=1 Tax=Naganishia vaughanmartiniae TaxID=1424756 RepID=A0ACC2WMS3_9TREE|nr:hypothetical protein QFC22_006115 [Naganishia vaughanmartiniae]
MRFSNIVSVTAVLASLASAVPTHRCGDQGACPKAHNVDNCYNPKQIALTFDDGPAGFEKDIMEALGDKKATFFLNGCNSQCIYDEENVKQIRALHAKGHTLGSHGWTHANFSTLSYDQTHQEFEKMEQAFWKILGLKPLYFRAPYGETGDNLMRVLAERGYKKNFLWSDNVGDADLCGVEYGKSVYENIAKTFPAPHMVLNHATYETTAKEILPYAICELEDAGYEIVAVDTCLGEYLIHAARTDVHRSHVVFLLVRLIGSQGEWPYDEHVVGEPQERDETWVC